MTLTVNRDGVKFRGTTLVNALIISVFTRFDNAQTANLAMHSPDYPISAMLVRLLW